MNAHRGLRGSLAALLIASLTVGGALLGTSAASAEELPADPAIEQAATEAQPEVQAADAVAEQAPAPAAQPEAQAPAPEQPAPEQQAVPEQPAAAPLAATLAAQGAAAVTAADESGLTVRATATGLDAASLPNGVYVGVIEAGTAESATMASIMGVVWVRSVAADGALTQELTLPAASFDRAKSYEVLIWTGHTNPGPDTNLLVTSVPVSAEQWDAVFPPATPTPQVVASVASADEAGLVLTAEVSGLDPAQLPNGVHVGVLPASVDPLSAVSGDFLATGTMRPADLPANGAFSLDVTVPVAKLSHGMGLQLLVWKRHTNPGAANNLAGVPVAVSAEQWDAVYPQSGPKLKGEVTEVANERIDVAVTGTGFENATKWPGQPTAHVYVAIIEQGTDLSAVDQGSVPNGAFDVLGNGSISGTLTQAAAQLDRGKQYELIAWPSRSVPSESNLYARAGLTIDWDRLFPQTDAPRLTVTPNTGLDPKGQTVTVRGTGYDVNTPIYVTTCADVPLDQLSFEFINDGCTDGAQAVGGRYTKQFAADGSFELQMTVSKRADATALYTIADHSAQNDRSQDAKAALSFASGGSVDPDPEPGQPGKAKATATVTEVKPGEGLNVRVQASGLPLVNGEVYVAIIERGTSDSLTQDAKYPAMEPFAQVKNGSLSLSMLARAGYLDRAKKYEALIWKQHSDPKAGNIFARADIAISSAQWDQLFSVAPKPAPKPQEPKPVPVTPTQSGAQQAGSLVWGVSSDFADYTTNKSRAGGRSGGQITTSGVGQAGGAYLFPQAGASWNAATQTGSVQYSGVVTFTAHQGLMRESFGNPVITVDSATSGTLSVGGRSFGLNLGAAGKSVGANGEVTWSNVPVSGSISGGGNGGGGSFAADPLTFTVGAASGVSYGTTTVAASTAARTAAATPPATTGVRVITPADKLVPGGEIEIEAEGFESRERDILVVVYSEPTVLDERAGADENGRVRWIGTLPEDLEPGEHTITLQGSVNAGAVITVVEKDEADRKPIVKRDSSKATTLDAEEATTAGIVPSSDEPVWGWWLAAIVLLAIAGTTTTLVVTKRRGGKNE